MIINDLDGYYIVFDTKNWNTELDTLSNNPIWEVVIKDDLKRETQMQSVMPWLLLGAKEYIGKSSNGEQTVKIDNKKEVKEKYKLVWPY